MSKTKKVVISLGMEDYLLLENVSDGGAEEYLRKIIKKEIDILRLKNGYAEMAQINLELAQMCFEADEECSRHYEENIKHSV